MHLLEKWVSIIGFNFQEGRTYWMQIIDLGQERRSWCKASVKSHSPSCIILMTWTEQIIIVYCNQVNFSIKNICLLFFSECTWLCTFRTTCKASPSRAITEWLRMCLILGGVTANILRLHPTTTKTTNLDSLRTTLTVCCCFFFINRILANN